MDKLAIFVPLAKADAAQRLVYGYFDETPDRAGEIFDYDSSKPNLIAWSESMQKASGGKSLGNIRGQHGKIAAGKLVELLFDDELKKVGFVAKIVDDNEWEKVEEGVYTGFSPGGKYAKRWPDGKHKRYTGLFKELSIVDVPCLSTAGFVAPESFTMVKADGTEEEVEFVIAKAYEPGNEATLARATEMAKAAAGDQPGKGGNAMLKYAAKDYVVQARAELIAENADAALAKMAAEADDTAEEDDADATTAADKEKGADKDKPLGKADPIAALNDAMAKADVALANANAVDIDDPFADLTKAAAALECIVASVGDQPVLAKCLYSVERSARLLETIGSIASSVAWEEKSENDTDSKLPAMAMDLMVRTKAFLIEMVQEETAELLASITSQLPDFTLAMIPPDGDEAAVVMALADQIVDMVKADGDLMEKAGARNSRGDLAKIQTMHDNAVELGAKCDAAVAKAEELEADNDRLTKALGDVTPKLEDLVKTVESLAASRDELEKTVAKLSGQPVPAKGARFAISKEADRVSGDVEQPLEKAAPTIAEAAALPPGQRQRALESIAINSRHRANTLPA